MLKQNKQNKRESMKQAQKKYRKTLQRDHRTVKNLHSKLVDDKQNLINFIKNNNKNRNTNTTNTTNKLVRVIQDMHNEKDILLATNYIQSTLPLVNKINQNTNLDKSSKFLLTNIISHHYYQQSKKELDFDDYYVDNVVELVEQQLDHSILSRNTKIVLSNILVDIQNKRNNIKNDNLKRNYINKKILSKCNYIKQQISVLEQLQKTNNVAKLSHYALSVITQSSHQYLLTLSDLASKTKLNGNRLLDFIANEQDTALKYTYDAKQKMIQHFSAKKLADAKKKVSFIFGNKMHRIMGFFALQIGNSKMSARIAKDYNITLNRNYNASETFLLDAINHIMNYYLVHCHLIKATDTGYHLTSLGIAFTNPYISTNLITTMLVKHPIQYQSDNIWRNIISNCVKPLRWINKHPSYQNYYGLAFALYVLSIHNFEQINNFTYKGKPYSLNLAPLTYFSIIFQILYSAFYGNNMIVDEYSVQSVSALQRLEKGVYKYYQKLNK